jgi:hypothetical protein
MPTSSGLLEQPMAHVHRQGWLADCRAPPPGETRLSRWPSRLTIKSVSCDRPQHRGSQAGDLKEAPTSHNGPDFTSALDEDPHEDENPQTRLSLEERKPTGPPSTHPHQRENPDSPQQSPLSGAAPRPEPAARHRRAFQHSAGHTADGICRDVVMSRSLPERDRIPCTMVKPLSSAVIQTRS